MRASLMKGIGCLESPHREMPARSVRRSGAQLVATMPGCDLSSGAQEEVDVSDEPSRVQRKCRSIKVLARSFQEAKRTQVLRKPGKKSRRYLKPGELAQIAQRKARHACTTIGRKRIIGMDGEPVTPGQNVQSVGSNEASQLPASPPPVSSIGTPLREFGPTCPQRKKLLAPKTPLTPAAQITLTRIPSVESRAPHADTRVSLTEVSAQPHCESHLESLPVELLVRIVCRLHHDQLRPAFHVCKILRQAVVIARQSHFNFTTPDRDRQELLGLTTPKRHQYYPFHCGVDPCGGALVRPATPQAPRQPPKPPQARIPLADMRQIVAPLFQGPATTPQSSRPPGLPRPSFRALASHRVLFNEEELCQAVAQHTL